MNSEEHRLQHLAWHAALESLINDFLAHNRSGKLKLLSNTTLDELFRWSHQQTIRPVETKA